MSKTFVYTCYGCEHWYSDKGHRYPRKHCGIVDHLNNCKIWKSFMKKEKETGCVSTILQIDRRI